jgi:hypothetical protein
MAMLEVCVTNVCFLSLIFNKMSALFLFPISSFKVPGYWLWPQLNSRLDFNSVADFGKVLLPQYPIFSSDDLQQLEPSSLAWSALQSICRRWRAKEAQMPEFLPPHFQGGLPVRCRLTPGWRDPVTEAEQNSAW